MSIHGQSDWTSTEGPVSSDDSVANHPTIDISKVFDSVPHDLLLEQMWKCGLTGSLWSSVCPGGGSVVWLASSLLRGPAGKHSRSLVFHYPCMSMITLLCFLFHPLVLPMIPKSSGGPDLSPLLSIFLTYKLTSTRCSNGALTQASVSML